MWLHLKNICKYISRCETQKINIYLSKHVSKTLQQKKTLIKWNNIKMYQWKKLQHNNWIEKNLNEKKKFVKNKIKKEICKKKTPKKKDIIKWIM